MEVRKKNLKINRTAALGPIGCFMCVLKVLEKITWKYFNMIFCANATRYLLLLEVEKNHHHHNISILSRRSCLQSSACKQLNEAKYFDEMNPCYGCPISIVHCPVSKCSSFNFVDLTIFPIFVMKLWIWIYRSLFYQFFSFIVGRRITYILLCHLNFSFCWCVCYLE